MRDHLNVNKFKIVKGVIEHNAHMAHLENILLSVLLDDDLSVGKLTLQMVIEAKDIYSSASQEIIRTFKLPPINFQADPYWILIDWESNDATVPPLISDIPISTLEKAVIDGKLLIPKVACNTQS